jgi:centrosomal protein CEP104
MNKKSTNTIIPLKYTIIYSSSNDKEYPVHNIMNGDYSPNNKGWMSLRYCSYPQEIIIQFYPFVTIKEIIIVIHESKIPSRIDIYSYSPGYNENISTSNQQLHSLSFDYVGHIIPHNHSSDHREIKKIALKTNQYNFTIQKCLYIKLSLSENYINVTRNPRNQVSLISFEAFGYVSNYNIFRPNINYSHDDYIPEGLITEKEFSDIIKYKIQCARKELERRSDGMEEQILQDIEELRKYGKRLYQLEQGFVILKYAEKNTNKLENEIKNIYQYVIENYAIYNHELLSEQDGDLEDNSDMNYSIDNNNNINVSNSQLNVNELNQNANVNYIQNEKSKEIYQRYINKRNLIKQSKEQAQEILKLENQSNINL